MTQSQAKRTEGELEIVRGHQSLGPHDNITRVLRGPKGEAVAFVNIWIDAKEQGEANAEYIRKAWNTHEDAIALARLVERYHLGHGPSPTRGEIFVAAREFLSRCQD